MKVTEKDIWKPKKFKYQSTMNEQVTRLTLISNSPQNKPFSMSVGEYWLVCESENASHDPVVTVKSTWPSQILVLTLEPHHHRWVSNYSHCTMWMSLLQVVPIKFHRAQQVPSMIILQTSPCLWVAFERGTEENHCKAGHSCHSDNEFLSWNPENHSHWHRMLQVQGCLPPLQGF